MIFKVNFHLAKKYDITLVRKMIEEYPKEYPTPKYLLFIRWFLLHGFRVKVYVAQVSKYVFVYRNGSIYKIRFSNHKPIYTKQMENDCDFYVGVSHLSTYTTDQIIAMITEKEGIKKKVVLSNNARTRPNDTRGAEILRTGEDGLLQTTTEAKDSRQSVREA